MTPAEGRGAVAACARAGAAQTPFFGENKSTGKWTVTASIGLPVTGEMSNKGSLF